MTKEELEKEAEEKFKTNNKDKDREHYYDRMWYKEGYLAGAEPREERIKKLEKQIEQMQDAKCISCTDLGGMLLKITDLEKQIEKMKCCGNCKYSNQESAYSIVCKVGGVDKSDYINTDDNQVCDKWEIKEND